MQNEKKKKWIKLSCIIGLAVLIVFVIITSIVIYSKREKLNDLKEDNSHISDSIEGQENENNFQESSEIIWTK